MFLKSDSRGRLFCWSFFPVPIFGRGLIGAIEIHPRYPCVKKEIGHSKNREMTKMFSQSSLAGLPPPKK